MLFLLILMIIDVRRLHSPVKPPWLFRILFLPVQTKDVPGLIEPGSVHG